MNKIELMEYKKYKLGDICKIFGRIGFRGYTTEDLVLSPSYGAISLSPSNIVDGIMDLSKCTYISWAKYEESPEIKIAPNDIVIVKTGNSYGRTAIIRNVEHPMTLNPQFVVLKDIQINPVYLAYFLKTDEFQKQIYGIVGGSAIPTLSQEDLASLIVRVPNENFQNTIADILDSLDGKIELNKQINDNLEAIAKQLYDYWFVQFDFPNEEGKPYKSSGGVMVWNEKLKREIPQGWDFCFLENLLTIRNGRDHKHLVDGEYPVYGSGGEMRKVSEYLYDGESVLMPRKGSLNNIMYVNEAFWTVDTMFYSVMKQSNCAKYIYYTIKDIDFTRWDSGTGVPSMTSSTLYSIKLVKPQSGILKKFDEMISPLFEHMKQISEQNTVLTKQRDELLPLLMNGQATVNYHLSDD